MNQKRYFFVIEKAKAKTVVQKVMHKSFQVYKKFSKLVASLPMNFHLMRTVTFSMFLEQWHRGPLVALLFVSFL